MGTGSELLLTFLLNAAWQVPLLAVAAGLCSLMLRRLSPVDRHLLWSVAMIATVLLPLVSVHIPVDSGRLILQSDAVPAEAPTSRAVPVAPLAGGMILTLYGVLILAGVGKLAWAGRGVRKIRRAAQSRKMTQPLRDAEEGCRARLGLMPVPILCSSSVAGPLTIGYLNPIIVLPEPLFLESTPELLRSVIGHELAHILRRDYLQKLLLELLYLPVSFHPAAWFLKKRIDQSRELACDEVVTREIVAPADYAQSMLDVARSSAQVPKPACSLGVLDGDILERRIRSVLRPGARFNRWIGRVAIGLVILSLGFLAIKASGLALGLATAGNLSGRVYDASRAVIPGARVTLTERQSGTRYLRKTGVTGDYSFDSLPVGRYTLIVESRGFARFRLNNVNPGRTARVNPVLQLGRVQETITVSSKLK